MVHPATRGGLCLLLWCGLATAQVAWREIDQLRPGNAALAYDEARGRLVLFTDTAIARMPWVPLVGQLWERADGRWFPRTDVVGPGPRQGHGLVYDPVRRVVVLFGGLDATGYLNDTWTYDGTRWTLRAPAHAPAARAHAAVTYDRARGRLVLFAGTGGSGSPRLDDTWEWDGQDWSLRSPAHRPPARLWAAMAYDAGRGRSVLFGGFAPAARNDTWEWDGVDWSARSPAHAPPVLGPVSMAYDAARGQVVHFPGAPFRDTWVFDGSDWRVASNVAAFGFRSGQLAAYDSRAGRVILFGGGDVTGGYTDTWSWDGSSTWHLELAEETPWARTDHGLAHDSRRHRTVLFGGSQGPGLGLFGDTWEWDGRYWHQLPTTPAPSPRQGLAVVFDAGRGVTVLFGGDDAAGPRGDTWEWDGRQWNARSLSGPSPRTQHAMAYDTVRQRVVLFGGTAGSARSEETWEYDGSAWTLRAAAGGPGPRAQHALAFDATRGVVLLYGGNDGLLNQDDLWAWDGTRWQLLQSGAAPSFRVGHTLAWDTHRGRLLLHGGPLTDMQEWDGQTWTQRDQSPPFGGRAGGAMVFVPETGRALVVGGGYPGGRVYGDFWEYGPVHPAQAVPFGLGCPGFAGVPRLATAGAALPWLGDRLAFDVSPVSPWASSLVLVGTSRTAFAGQRLPLDLAPLGAWGCFLQVSIGLVQPPATPLSLPAGPALAGQSLYAQALVFDREANAAGLCVSQPLQLLLGTR